MSEQSKDAAMTACFCLGLAVIAIVACLIVNNDIKNAFQMIDALEQAAKMEGKK